MFREAPSYAYRCACAQALALWNNGIIGIMLAQAAREPSQASRS